MPIAGSSLVQIPPPEEVAGVEGPGGPLPAEGEVPLHVCLELIQLLSAQTTTPETCWFAIWSGWGLLSSSSIGPYNTSSPLTWWERRRQRTASKREAATFDAIPQIEPPWASTGRRYLPFRGPVKAACSFEPFKPHGVAPSFWWPEDRAWIVVTEIDSTSTYVAGTRETIDAVLASKRLESVEVDRTARMG